MSTRIIFSDYCITLHFYYHIILVITKYYHQDGHFEVAVANMERRRFAAKLVEIPIDRWALIVLIYILNFKKSELNWKFHKPDYSCTFS